MRTTGRTFLENFTECCSASCIRPAIQAEQEDMDYRSVSQTRAALYREIEEKLGADRLLINRFDAAKNGEMAREQDYVYRQGFRDCVVLLRWLGLF